MGTHYEAVDYNDPLSLLLQAEGEDTDELESFFDAGTHRAKSFERDKDVDVDDTLGASPAELAAQDWLN